MKALLVDSLTHQKGWMAKASSLQFGVGGVLPFNVPATMPELKHSDSSIFPEALPMALNCGPTSGGMKAAIVSFQIGFAPRWHIRFTMGDQPPDMATASHSKCERSERSMDLTPLPPLTLMILPFLRVSITAAMFMPWSFMSPTVRCAELLLVKTAMDLPAAAP